MDVRVLLVKVCFHNQVIPNIKDSNMNIYLHTYILEFNLTDHPSRVGRLVNMSYEPKWQRCSNDSDIIEKKKELGFKKLNYCLRCAVLDGWVQSKVSLGIYDKIS